MGVMLAPGLVEHHPEDDGGMVEPLTHPLTHLTSKLVLQQRRRLNTEEKEKVVAAVWGTYSINCLASVDVLH